MRFGNDHDPLPLLVQSSVHNGAGVKIACVSSEQGEILIDFQAMR